MGKNGWNKIYTITSSMKSGEKSERDALFIYYCAELYFVAFVCGQIFGETFSLGREMHHKLSQNFRLFDVSKTVRKKC